MIRKVLTMLVLSVVTRESVGQRISPISNTQALTSREEEVLENLQQLVMALDEVIKEIDPDNSFGPELETVKLLKELVAELRKLAQAVTEAQSEFLRALENYTNELRATPPKLREKSESLKKHAMDEPYEHLQEDYLRFSAILAELADRLEKRSYTFESDVALYRETLPHLERTVLFLDRVDDALKVIPEDLMVVESTRRNFEIYKKGFEQFEAIMHTFHMKLTEGATSSNVTKAQWNGRDPGMLPRVSVTLAKGTNKPAFAIASLRRPVSENVSDDNFDSLHEQAPSHAPPPPPIDLLLYSPEVLDQASSSYVQIRLRPFIERKVSYSKLERSGLLERRRLRDFARGMRQIGYKHISEENGLGAESYQTDLRKFGPALVSLRYLEP
jgi:hypothetical protein